MPHRRHISGFIACCSLLTWSANAGSSNWPQWRGPLANGTTVETGAPTILSESNLLWQVELPGPGSSTPAVWGEHIFLTSELDGQDGVLCYDRQGRERWRHSFGQAAQAKHRAASGCNPSPITDGQRVYTYYKSGVLAALDFSGGVTWRMNLYEKYGPNALLWDLGTSPVLAAGNLIVAVMHNGPSYLVALDPRTGEQVWHTPRKLDSVGESYDAYTTPEVVTLDGRETVVSWGADYLTGHDATTGQPLWHSGSYNPDRHPMWRTIASAVTTDGITVIPFGRGDFLAGVRIGGRGDITEKNTLWTRADIGADVPTPVADGKNVLVLSDRGVVTCIEAASGKTRWQTKLPSGALRFYASPVLAGRTLYCAASDGNVFTGQITGQGLVQITESALKDVLVASPVVVDGMVLIRTRTRLSCFGRRD